ncbi:MAG: hypothetical protein LQ339_006667 [Xanthoria mediterranea]|nr:MAG: hypothetical protein LQ339_006667 [Xanthoria mediterranea]
MAQRHPLTPTTLRRLIHRQTFHRPPSRSFHKAPNLPGSAFFDLGRLSVSRESQHLSKEKGRPRTEFAPHLELINSSEVAPFARMSHGVGKTANSESHGEAGRKAADEKTTSEPPPTKELAEKFKREYRASMYLIKRTLRIQAVLEDLRQLDREPEGAHGARLSEAAARVIAATLPNVEDQITTQEIDAIAMAAESPGVARLKLKMMESSEDLCTAMRASRTIGNPILDKTGANATTDMDYSITRLVEELEAKKRAADRIRYKAAARADTFSILRKIAKTIILAGAVWVLSNHRYEIADWFAFMNRQDESPSNWRGLWATIRSFPKDQGKFREETGSWNAGDEHFRRAPASRSRRWFWAS